MTIGKIITAPATAKPRSEGGDFLPDALVLGLSNHTWRGAQRVFNPAARPIDAMFKT